MKHCIPVCDGWGIWVTVWMVPSRGEVTKITGAWQKLMNWHWKNPMKRQDDWIEPYFCIMEIWLMGWQDGRSFLFCKEETTKVTKAWGKMLRF